MNDFAALPLALVFMVLIAVMFTALGTAIASVLSDFQGFQLVMNFLVMPIFFLSGALFPLTNVPKLMVDGDLIRCLMAWTGCGALIGVATLARRRISPCCRCSPRCCWFLAATCFRGSSFEAMAALLAGGLHRILLQAGIDGLDEHVGCPGPGSRAKAIVIIGGGPGGFYLIKGSAFLDHRPRARE